MSGLISTAACAIFQASIHRDGHRFGAVDIHRKDPSPESCPAVGPRVGDAAPEVA